MLFLLECKTIGHSNTKPQQNQKKPYPSSQKLHRKAATFDVTSTLRVRSQPNTNSKVLFHLYPGRFVTELSKSNGWSYVEYEKGSYGYVSSQYLNYISSAVGTVATQSSSLNVRTGNSTSAPKIGSLPNGAHVPVIGQRGGWYLVLYNGDKSGFVSSDYLQVSGSVPNFSFETLASDQVLRGTPSSKGNNIQHLRKGALVVVFRRGDSWCYVSSPGLGHAGYMPSKSLRH
ncbi:MAG: SH3 domain-containing protein [Eubacteriaceae bacterium]|nr:SH3 domain-containing protein [Eubacteriaceae bacterium]